MGIFQILRNPWIQKGTAITVGGAAAYNIANETVDNAKRKANEEMGHGYLDLFVRTQTSPVRSNLLERAKNLFRREAFDADEYSTWIKIKNFAFSATEETIKHGSDIIAIAGAFSPMLFSNVSGKITKPIAALSTGFLMIRGAKTIITDVFGIGKKGL